MLISIILFTLIWEILIFRYIAKLSFVWSTLVSIARIISSLSYVHIFPENDITRFHWDAIISCNPQPIFKFTSIATSLYCNNILDNPSEINLIYSIIGSIGLSLLVRLAKNINQKRFTKKYSLIEYEISNRFNKIFNLIILLTPNSLLYTSAISKDVFQFCFVVSLIYFFFKPGTYSFINFVFLVFLFYFQGHMFFLFWP